MRFIKAILFVLIFLICNTSYAYQNYQKPYIKDFVGKLSISDLYVLNNKIENYNIYSKNKVGILIVQNINDTYDSFNDWNIGTIIVISTQNHLVSIQKIIDNNSLDSKIVKISFIRE